MNKNRIINIEIILIYLILFLLFYVLNFDWTCPIKYFLHIECPGCGLTRSFKALIHLDIISSIKYNLLGIPIFLIVIVSIFYLLKDIIKGENKTTNFILKYISKYYIVIFLILIVNMVINNIK